MAGYLASPTWGARTYNAAHTYLPGIVLAGVGAWQGSALAVQAAAVWVGHVGADRAAGYGLKLPTGISDTHLGRRGRARGPDEREAGE